METDRVSINTGLDGFVLLKGIKTVSSKTILGWTQLVENQSFLAMEALAQLGAIHARYLCDFNFHAFLLKMNRFDQMAPIIANDPLDLTAKLLVRTQSAFTYGLKAVSNNETICNAEFSFAVLPYDQRFKKQELKAHYKRIFTCLSD